MKVQYDSILGFAQEIERQNALKNDYVVPSTKLKMMSDDKTMEVEGNGLFNANGLFHSQLAESLSVPKRYYDAMEVIPGLRAHNVNSWLERSGTTKHLIRTVDKTARAYLSDRYRPIDNMLVMSALLPILPTLGKVNVHGGVLSEKRFYLQFSTEKLTKDVKVGQTVQAGVTVANSEVGCGAVDVLGWLKTLQCKNGMVHESLMRKYHVGKRIDTENYHIFQDDTIKAEVESLRLRLRDVIMTSLSETFLNDRVDKLRSALGDYITKPIATIENVTNRYPEISSDWSEALLKYMGDSGEMNRYGLANAVTYMAHEVNDADRGFELEKIGGEIIELSPREWEVIAG